MSRPSTSAPSAPRLTALSASTLSSAHERSRSLSLNSPPSVSTNRTILRNLHTLGSGLSVLVKEQREREVEAKRGRVGLEEVRVKEDELEEVRAGMRRVVEVLEADGEGAKMVEEVRRE